MQLGLDRMILIGIHAECNKHDSFWFDLWLDAVVEQDSR